VLGVRVLADEKRRSSAMERTRVRHTGSAVYSEDDFSPARVTRNSLREKRRPKRSQLAVT
ncbi:MAG: hypothetical protein KIG60_03350, partial [Caryophanon sp.]|nr:hypothetical protein [Caryophanon sp.]